jgi:hypothetical protein
MCEPGASENPRRLCACDEPVKPLQREIAAFAWPRAFMPQAGLGRGVLRETNLCGLERVSHELLGRRAEATETE